MGKEEKKDVAHIESIVTDMGNGSSECSSCKTQIDLMEVITKQVEIMHEILVTGSRKSEIRCPNPLCSKILEPGACYSLVGGSDF